MTGRQVLRRLEDLWGSRIRQKGSHVRCKCRCGRYFTTVPDHRGKDLPTGTLRAIERDLEPCFGQGWLR